MDFQQIKYFTTAAKCLNFSRAAELLFITQPALSRQINSIEKELNIQLFVRNGHELKLTPAAKMLLSEFSEIYEHYESTIEQAHAIQHGVTGELRIGVLDGMRVDDILPDMLNQFTGEYPEIEIVLQYMNLNDLTYNLYNDTLDLSFTLKFEIANRKNILYRQIAESRDYIVVSRTHRLADRDYVEFSDLENETFIMLNSSTSETSTALIMERFESYGFRPNIKYSSSISTSALFVQAGLGISMFDSRNIFRSLPNIKFLDTEQISDPSLVVAWHQNNKSIAFQTFLKRLI